MKNKIFLLISVIIIIFALLNYISEGNLKNISDEDKSKLMEVLKIENSYTFLPIKIKKNDLGFGDITLCYTLKYEISKEEYNTNKLNYSDIDTTQISLNWKESKDENTYICYVREYEYNEYRKVLFNELKRLKNKY